MANYRTTEILKTDIVDSTPRLAGQTQAEMGLQRKQHRQFISEITATHFGSIFQEEGDAYLIEFPSVTDATLAALDMHQDLRSLQAGRSEKQRLAIRAVITVGDILHQEKDTIGMTMNLTARIEKITPPDEIYLSHAAWLVLNKAEVQTSFVGEFPMKGFVEPEKVYKVDQKHRIRVLTDQYIVFTDVRGWTEFTKSKEVEAIEIFLFEYDDILNRVCENYRGVIRNISGDMYFMTFSEADNLFAAAQELCAVWKEMLERYGLGLSVAIHKGDLNIIRSSLYSNDIHTTVYLERLTSITHPDTKTMSVIASGRIKEIAIGTEWENLFQTLDRSKINDSRLKSVVEENGAFWFLPKGD